MYNDQKTKRTAISPDTKDVGVSLPKLKMKNDYRYLVANPFGLFLCRCKTMEQVNMYVDKHFKKAEKAYITLTGHKLYRSNYQVRDLNEIPTFEEI